MSGKYYFDKHQWKINAVMKRKSSNCVGIYLIRGSCNCIKPQRICYNGLYQNFGQIDHNFHHHVLMTSSVFKGFRIFGSGNKLNSWAHLMQVSV